LVNNKSLLIKLLMTYCSYVYLITNKGKRKLTRKAGQFFQYWKNKN
jgi:hypothetical protein